MYSVRMGPMRMHLDDDSRRPVYSVNVHLQLYTVGMAGFAPLQPVLLQPAELSCTDHPCIIGWCKAVQALKQLAV